MPTARRSASLRPVAARLPQTTRENRNNDTEKAIEARANTILAGKEGLEENTVEAGYSNQFANANLSAFNPRQIVSLGRLIEISLTRRIEQYSSRIELSIKT